MNVCESQSAMFLVLIESLYKPEVIFDKSVDEVLILMRLAHAYDTESTLKTCQKWVDVGLKTNNFYNDGAAY